MERTTPAWCSSGRADSRREAMYMIPFLTVHYLTYVFIPKHTDIDEAVDEAMKPYGDEFPVKPWKKYIGPRETAAMAKHYGLRRSAKRKLAAQMKDWCGGEGGIDGRGLFAQLKS